MIDYEILLLLDPEVPDGRAEEIVTRIREQVERSGGSWTSHDPWGRRRLAYEIQHKQEGVYHLLRFTATPEGLEEISRVLKITDGVMRHMAVRQPAAAPTRPPEPVDADRPERQHADEESSPVA